MMRKLAAVALLGSLGLLALSGLDDLRDLRDWRPERRYAVKAVHRGEPADEVHQIRRLHDLRAEDVVGAYEFSESGNVFGHFPWTAHVVLTLKETGRYILDLDLTVDGDHEVETVQGDYRIEEDRIVLLSLSGDEEVDGRLEKHALRFEDGRLVPDVGWPARAALGAAGVGDFAFDRLK